MLKEPLSIGVVCYPTLGGSGVVAVDIAAGMARRGHRVYVIAPAPPRRSLPNLENLRFERVEPPAHPIFDHPPYSLAVAGKVVEIARRDGLDVVHSHFAVPHAAGAFLAAHALGAERPRMLTTLHGTDVTQLGADPAVQSIIASTIAAAEGITTPSDFLRGEAERLFGFSRSAIDVIPNFVDTDRFSPAAPPDPTCLADRVASISGSKPPVGRFLVHVSNFRAVKRTGDLIDVLAKVRASAPAHLLMVGDGPERAATRDRAIDRGLDQHVTFLGERSDVWEFLGHADALLLTSETESFGVAALEAMSSGVPVFAYRVGGLPEVVTGGAGELVDPFDSSALAAAVCRALADPSQLDSMRVAARRRAVAHFRAEPTLDRYEALYRRLAVAPRQRG